MVRWTQSPQDIRHIIEINEDLYAALKRGFIIKVVLNNGMEVEGLLSAHRSGNNASATNPVTSYYSEITLKLLSGDSTTIDLLSIRSIVNATSRDKLRQYEEAGIITIAEFPEGLSPDASPQEPS